MTSVHDFVLNYVIEITSDNDNLRKQADILVKRFPSFYDEIIEEYIEAIKIRIIDDYTKLTGTQYDLVSIELDEIDLRKLFW